jgi:hypothetical protein
MSERNVFLNQPRRIGRRYAFSAANPVQSVDPRDAHPGPLFPRCLAGDRAMNRRRPVLNVADSDLVTIYLLQHR